MVYLLRFCSIDMEISKHCPGQLQNRCRLEENQAGLTIGRAPPGFLPWTVRFPLRTSVSFSHPWLSLVRTTMFVYKYGIETFMLYRFNNVTFFSRGWHLSDWTFKNLVNERNLQVCEILNLIFFSECLITQACFPKVSQSLVSK